MARGFTRGLLFGGFIGAIIALFAVPQRKPLRKMRVMMSTGRKIGKNVQKIYKDVRGGINEIID